jgi:HIP---CoA ligase
MRVSGDFAWLSYAQVGTLAARLAAAVRTLPGVSRGDLLGICAPNGPEWLIADFAAALSGLCPVGFHTTYTAPELAATVARVQPTVALIGAGQLAAWMALIETGAAHALRAVIVQVQ